MAEVYGERGMLDAEEGFLETGYHVCKTDKLKNESERANDEHQERLLELAGGRQLNWGWTYSDFGRNGVHEMLLEEYEEGYHDASVKKDLYDMELYYVSDKKMEKLLSTQVPRGITGGDYLGPYIALFYGNEERGITKYFVFHVDDEGAQFVFENEDLNISYEAAKKEFEQFRKTRSEN